jgi:LacI family transcriptional regulator
VTEAENYTEQGGYQGMQELLRSPQPPTAIFAANDLMAIGAMQAVREAGLRIPEDVAVAGFDDIPAAALVNPGLTTIRQHQEEMGRRAAEMLIERLDGKHEGGGRELEMPFELVVRGSA